MKRREIIIDSERMYALTVDETKDNYYLEVTCGGFAMYQVVVLLYSDEVKRFQSEGKEFLDDLAYDILKHNKKYADRTVTP